MAVTKQRIKKKQSKEGRPKKMNYEFLWLIEVGLLHSIGWRRGSINVMRWGCKGGKSLGKEGESKDVHLLRSCFHLVFFCFTLLPLRRREWDDSPCMFSFSPYLSQFPLLASLLSLTCTPLRQFYRIRPNLFSAL